MLHMSPTCRVVLATCLRCRQFLATCPMSRDIYWRRDFQSRVATRSVCQFCHHLPLPYHDNGIFLPGILLPPPLVALVPAINLVGCYVWIPCILVLLPCFGFPPSAPSSHQTSPHSSPITQTNSPSPCTTQRPAITPPQAAGKSKNWLRYRIFVFGNYPTDLQHHPP